MLFLLSFLAFAGNVDLSKLLAEMDARIVKAKEEASGRKDILDELEKWKFACQEENWLDKYEEVHIKEILLEIRCLFFISKPYF